MDLFDVPHDQWDESIIQFAGLSDWENPNSDVNRLTYEIPKEQCQELVPIYEDCMTETKQLMLGPHFQSNYHFSSTDKFSDWRGTNGLLTMNLGDEGINIPNYELSDNIIQQQIGANFNNTPSRPTTVRPDLHLDKRPYESRETENHTTFDSNYTEGISDFSNPINPASVFSFKLDPTLLESQTMWESFHELNNVSGQLKYGPAGDELMWDPPWPKSCNTVQEKVESGLSDNNTKEERSVRRSSSRVRKTPVRYIDEFMLEREAEYKRGRGKQGASTSTDNSIDKKDMPHVRTRHTRKSYIMVENVYDGTCLSDSESPDGKRDGDFKKIGGENSSGRVRLKKINKLWTQNEIAKLVDGVSLCGVGNWSQIKKLVHPSLENRTSVDLKDKWRNLLRASGAEWHYERQIEPQKNMLIEIPEPLLLRIRELSVIHPYPRERKLMHSQTSGSQTPST